MDCGGLSFSHTERNSELPKFRSEKFYRSGFRTRPGIRQSGPTSYADRRFDWPLGPLTTTRSNFFSRDAMPLRNLKSRRLRSVFRLRSWQPTTLNLSILLLCIHENRRRFDSQNRSHMALFSAASRVLFSANYASQCELRANARLSALLFSIVRSPAQTNALTLTLPGNRIGAAATFGAVSPVSSTRSRTNISSEVRPDSSSRRARGGSKRFRPAHARGRRRVVCVRILLTVNVCTTHRLFARPKHRSQQLPIVRQLVFTDIFIWKHPRCQTSRVYGRLSRGSQHPLRQCARMCHM